MEKRHARLARNRAGKQRLPHAGRAHQEHSFGDFCAQFGEFFWRPQELHHLLQLLLRFARARYVLERDLLFLLARLHFPRPRLAEGERPLVGALHLAHHKPDEEGNEEERNQEGNDGGQPRERASLVFHFHGKGAERFRGHAVVLHEFRERLGRLLFGVHRLFALQRHHQRISFHADVRDLAFFDILHHLAYSHGGGFGKRRRNAREQRRHEQKYAEQDEKISDKLPHTRLSFADKYRHTLNVR